MIAADTTGIGNSANSSSITVSNFSTNGANRVLILCAELANNGGGTTISSISGGGLTWRRVGNASTGNSVGVVEMWSAFAPTQLTNITITVTLAQSNASNSVAIASYANIYNKGASPDICVINKVNGQNTGNTNSLSFSRNSQSKNGLNIFCCSSPSATTITAGAAQAIVVQENETTGASSRIAIIAQNNTNNRGVGVTDSASFSTNIYSGYVACELVDANPGMTFLGTPVSNFNSSNLTTLNITVGTSSQSVNNQMYEVPVGVKLFLVIGVNGSGNSVSSVSDSRGNIYTKSDKAAVGSSSSELWVCENVATQLNNGDTISITYSSTVAGGACIVGAAIGLQTSNSLDVSAHATGSSTSPTSPNITNAVANEIIIGIIAYNDTNRTTTTDATGLFNEIFGTSTGIGPTGGAGIQVKGFWKYQTSINTFDFAGNLAQSETWTCFIAGYEEAQPASNNVSASGPGTNTTQSGGTLTGTGTIPSPGLTSGAYLSPTGGTITSTTPGLLLQQYTPDGNGNFNFTFSGLAPGQTYYYGVYTLDGSGNYIFSAPTAITIPALIKKKRYYYKVYSTSLQYIKTWSSEVGNDPNFRMVIFGSASELKVKLSRPYTNFGEGVDVVLNYKVELWCMDYDAPNGVKIYTGYIADYAPTIDGQKQYVEITLLGYATKLQDYVLTDQATGDTTITYSNFDPGAAIKDAIDKYHSAGGNNVFYTPTSVVLTNQNVTYPFVDNTIQEVIDKITQMTPYNYFWYIDANGIINGNFSNIAKPDHKLTIGKDIAYLQSTRRLEGVVNAVAIIGGGGTSLYNLYKRATSITSWGEKRIRIQDLRVQDNNTSDQMAKRELDQYQNPEYRTVVHIIDNNGDNNLQGQNIEAFTPGQTIQVVNLSGEPVLIIQSIDYYPDHLVIEASTRLPETAKDLRYIALDTLTLAQDNIPVIPTVRTV